MKESTTKKETSTEEKVVVTAVISAAAAGLLVFAYCTKMGGDGLSDSPKRHEPAASASHSGQGESEQRIAELESDIERLQENSHDEQTIANLEADLEERSKRAQENIAASRRRVGELEARIVELSKGPAPEAGSSSEIDTEISKLNTQLALAEGDRQNLASQLSALSASSSDGTNDLAKELQALKLEKGELTAELDQLRAGSPSNPVMAAPNVDKDTAIKMNQLMETTAVQKEEISKQDVQIKELTAQVNQFKAGKTLFVESADDLPEKARGLFSDLNQLEGKSQAEVRAAYGQYLTKHGATAKKRIKFGSGSSSLTASDRAEIASLTKEADRNSYFFIVGYADQAGSAEGNRKLSSARSTSVAKELAAQAQGYQSAQAVYLGQTKRFGASAENRVVEIWEIK